MKIKKYKELISLGSPPKERYSGRLFKLISPNNFPPKVTHAEETRWLVSMLAPKWPPELYVLSP